MRIYLIISIICSCLTSFGQIGNALIGNKKLIVGQSTSITYMLKIKNESPKNFVIYKDSIPTFNSKSKKGIYLEIIKPFHDTIVEDQDHNKIWIGGYTVIAWDSGHFFIPEIWCNQNKVKFPQIEIEVSLEKVKKGVELYDIHEQFEELPEKPLWERIKAFMIQNWLWFIIGFMLLIGLFLYFKLRKKDKQNSFENELSLREKSIKAIEELNQQKLWEKGKLKKHYTDLAHILKVYIGICLDINLLEKTTYETNLLLQQKGISKEQINKIEEVLIQADLVKFAKSTPDEFSILRNSAIAIELIQTIEQVEC